MPVMKEYLCIRCGEVEHTLPVCPKCGATEPNLKRQFRTPIQLKGDMTKFKDRNIAALVASTGLKDYSNNENTKHTRDTKSLWGDKKEFAKVLASNPSMFGGVKVDETRKVLSQIGKVTKIYDTRDIKSENSQRA
jgi:hypothetical protein